MLSDCVHRWRGKLCGVSFHSLKNTCMTSTNIVERNGMINKFVLVDDADADDGVRSISATATSFPAVFGR